MEESEKCLYLKKDVCEVLQAIRREAELLGDAYLLENESRLRLHEKTKEKFGNAGDRLQQWVETFEVGHEPCFGEKTLETFLALLGELIELLKELILDGKPSKSSILAKVLELAKLLACPNMEINTERP